MLHRKRIASHKRFDEILFANNGARLFEFRLNPPLAPTARRHQFEFRENFEQEDPPMPSEDRLDILFRQRQAEVEESEREEREKAERERERDLRRQQLATELETRVGGILAALVSQHSAPQYQKVAGLAFDDDEHGCISVTFNSRGGNGNCHDAALEFLVQADRTIRIVSSGRDFRAPVDESVAMDALTPQEVTRRFRNFLAAALA